jgi:riboflavin synthase
MFTGLIEEIGRIRDPRPLGNGRAFRIEVETVLEGLSPGDSVAIDGVCLTATSLYDDSFEVQVVATTLERTALGDYGEGRRVNLERALALGDRLGGHLVQGHVDGVGKVRSVRPVDELVLIDFDLPQEVADVTVLHGSIALNGVSLTVNALPEPGVCGVSIIPFTWSHTALADLRPGDRVNVEADLIGKYVRRLLGRPGERTGASATDLLRGWGY